MWNGRGLNAKGARSYNFALLLCLSMNKILGVNGVSCVWRQLASLAYNRLKSGWKITSSHFQLWNLTTYEERISIAVTYLLYCLLLKCTACTLTNTKEELISHFYSKVFNEDFNLSFVYPKSDTCGTCEQLMIELSSLSDNPSKKQVAEQRRDEHHRSAEKFYSDIRLDTEMAKKNTHISTVSSISSRIYYYHIVLHAAVMGARIWHS